MLNLLCFFILSLLELLKMVLFQICYDIVTPLVPILLCRLDSTVVS